ncbi:MAG: hypothetical protein K9L78_02670 [Victivallales bacterium]|nr:hypothetical protein [Victivallales bacterium]MCF7888999.1 hypothetical protein [Victivallales bacterium]
MKGVTAKREKEIIYFFLVLIEIPRIDSKDRNNAAGKNSVLTGAAI